MQSLRLDAAQMLIGLRRPCAASERCNPGGSAVFDETRTVVWAWTLTLSLAVQVARSLGATEIVFSWEARQSAGQTNCEDKTVKHIILTAAYVCS